MKVPNPNGVEEARVVQRTKRYLKSNVMENGVAMESSTKYLEEELRLTGNREKSRAVSVFAIPNLKFFGFALGRNGKERLINGDFYDLATAYQSVHVND